MLPEERVIATERINRCSSDRGRPLRCEENGKIGDLRRQHQVRMVLASAVVEGFTVTFGIRCTRSNRVDVDAMLVQLGSQRLCEADERSLGHPVRATTSATRSPPDA